MVAAVAVRGLSQALIPATKQMAVIIWRLALNIYKFSFLRVKYTFRVVLIALLFVYAQPDRHTTLTDNCE